MALSTLKLEDYDRINAYRAKNEAQTRQDAEAARVKSKEDSIKAKLRKTQQDNYQNLVKKIKDSSPLKLNAVNSREVAWATLKLPEIMEGLTLAEHKERERQKKRDFKKSLD